MREEQHYGTKKFEHANNYYFWRGEVSSICIVLAVRKDFSTITKIRAVFDAPATTSSGVSLNDVLMVGPTIHASLADVLLHFHFHHVALVADISRMYRAVALSKSDRDLDRFIWRSTPDQLVRYYLWLVSSAFIANMCVKKNGFPIGVPFTAKAVHESFNHVDDGNRSRFHWACSGSTSWPLHLGRIPPSQVEFQWSWSSSSEGAEVCSYHPYWVATPKH